MSDKAAVEHGLPLEDNGIPRDEAARPARPAGRRRLIFVPVFILGVLLGGFIGLYFQPPGLQAAFRFLELEPGAGTNTPIAVAMEKVTQREEVAVLSEGDVVALGRIIPQGDVITVSPPFGSGDARIADIKVAVGDVVSAGDVLALMDSLPQLEGAVETAEANLAVSEAALLQTREVIRASRSEAEASLARAEATEAAAQAELTRTTELMERGVTTRAALDNAIARANEATRDVEKSRATLSRYADGSGQARADIAVAEANLAAARASLAQARRDLEQAYVRAPSSGTVLDIHVQAGERPESDGILDLGDTSQMTVEAEVYQTLIGKVAIGDPATVTADALPQALTGRVTAIGLSIGRQSITSDDPAANTEARVVDVIVTLDPDGSSAAQRFTNLQVVTRIDAGRVQE